MFGLIKITAFGAFISDTVWGHISSLWKWNISLQMANDWDFVNNTNEGHCQKFISKKSILLVLEVFVKMSGIPSTLYALCGLSGENI